MGYGFTSKMKEYFEGECKGDGWAAYKLSCEMMKNGFDDVFVQTHFRKAAELGCSRAYVALGTYALRNNLLEDYSVIDEKYYQSQDKSIELFKKACSMKDAYGKFMYAQCLLYGIHIEKDENQAQVLLQESVKHISEENVISMVSEIHRYLNSTGFNTTSGVMAMKDSMSIKEFENGDKKYKKAS